MIIKKILVDNIYHKLGKNISKLIISDIIDIICDYISEELKANRSFSIKNFGTFSPYVHPAHDGLNIDTGELQHVSSWTGVRFHPHIIFNTLLDRKRKRFK